MKHWLESPVQVEKSVLTQMKAFALSTNASTYMAAKSVAEMIDVQVQSLFLAFPC
jgi:hypothetical protein